MVILPFFTILSLVVLCCSTYRTKQILRPQAKEVYLSAFGTYEYLKGDNSYG